MSTDKIKDIARRCLPRNRFARGVSVLAGGTAAGQAIIVAASPILTRLYSPEDFGVLAVFASLLGILGVIASMRYQLAIPLPESDEDAANVTVLSLLMVLSMTLITAAIVIPLRQPIAGVLNTPLLAEYIWLLPLGLLLIGVYQVLSYWATRTKAFGPIAQTKLTQSLIMVLIQITAYTLGPVSLLLARILGQAAGAGRLAQSAMKGGRLAFERVDRRGLITAAVRFRRFPLYSTWGGGFNKIGLELPSLLFAALFSASIAGIYMLAHRVLAVPMSIVGKAVADVFLSQAADDRRSGALAITVAHVHVYLARAAMPPAIIIVLFGPELFAKIFGEDWRQAGQFAQLMSPWMLMAFVTSPLSMLFQVQEQPTRGVMFQLFLLTTRVLSIFIGALSGDILVTVGLFAFSNAAAYMLLLYLLTRSCQASLHAMVCSDLFAFAKSLFYLAPLVIGSLLVESDMLLIALSILTIALLSIYYWKLVNFQRKNTKKWAET